MYFLKKFLRQVFKPMCFCRTIHRPYLLHTLSSSGPHLYIKIQAKNSRLDLGFNATVKAKGNSLQLFYVPQIILLQNLILVI